MVNIRALVLLAVISPSAMASPHDLTIKDTGARAAPVWGEIAGFENKVSVRRLTGIARLSTQALKATLGQDRSEGSDESGSGSITIVHSDYFSGRATQVSDKSGIFQLCAF